MDQEVDQEPARIELPETSAEKMRRHRRRAAPPGVEIWETTTDGVVWYPDTDTRGVTHSKKVGGQVGSILRITTEKREIAQDACVRDNDPFLNGMLKRVDADQNDDERTATPNALSTEELVQTFAKNGNPFRLAVDKLSEFNVRRLSEQAVVCDASASQIAYLEQVIKERFRKEGSQPAYEELRAGGEVTVR